MRRTLAALVFLLAACHGAQTGVHAVPGKGAISVEIAPSPIIARPVRGDLWEFPFDVIVRETGGHAMTVSRVTATVYAGGLNVGGENWDAAKLRADGFATSIPAYGTLRYHMTPRRSVPSEGLINSLSAELKVEATDDTGAAASASTAVGVRR